MPFTLDSINPPHIETFQREDGLFDWRLIAGNGETVCQTSQGFNTRGNADRAAERAIELFAMDPEVRAV